MYNCVDEEERENRRKQENFKTRELVIFGDNLLFLLIS